LTESEQRKFIAACEGAFKPLAQAGLLTGCRLGELQRLVCGDYDPEAQTLLVLETKTDAPRTVSLTLEGARFFDGLTAGRAGAAFMLTRDDGSPWTGNLQERAMKAACARAGLPPASFHALRRSHASLAVRRGVNPLMLAKNLGHSVEVLTQHYAHHLTQERTEELRGKMGAPIGLLDA
jgi:integrase